MSRCGLENFARLLGGKCRIAFQQSCGMGERHLNGPGRLCCTAYIHVTNLPRAVRIHGDGVMLPIVILPLEMQVSFE
jgi:hypothetical protein